MVVCFFCWFFFSPPCPCDFILENLGLVRLIFFWALGILSLLKTKLFPMPFLGQAMLTFEPLLTAVTLQRLTDYYSPLRLQKYREGRMIFRKDILSACSCLDYAFVDQLSCLPAFGLRTLKKRVVTKRIHVMGCGWNLGRSDR